MKLTDIIFKDLKHDYNYYLEKYPNRNLESEKIVTRYAPSPTGSIHMGNLYSLFIENKFAKQTNGIFYLRVEDTDQKRKVENGIPQMLADLKDFKIEFDEYPDESFKSVGEYGPYIQSERRDIYLAFCKKLFDEEKAYVCFCDQFELEEIRNKQSKRKERIGYYGDFAKCRNLDSEEVLNRINNGEKFVIRFKSQGDFNKKIVVKDLVKGKVELPENDEDLVIIKSDGLPTYHFAHAVDDYLMGTTHVIRGDEWLPSLSKHIQLFVSLGFKPPKYAHLSPLLKEENGTRRKLSKRKDPEAKISFYHELGIPNKAIMLYLQTIANSNFELWYEQNKDKTLEDFEMTFSKMGNSGTLFDLEKVLNISKNYLSRLSKDEIYEEVYEWAERYDLKFKNYLDEQKEYIKEVFNIEREQKKPRKDFTSYSMIFDEIWYMFETEFENREKQYEFDKITDSEEIKNILDEYMSGYFDVSSKDNWFNKMKECSEKLGYTSNMKEYKENPEEFKGNIADFSNVLRIALTTKAQTPDLYQIMKLIGEENIKKRFKMIDRL